MIFTDNYMTWYSLDMESVCLYLQTIMFCTLATFSIIYNLYLISLFVYMLCLFTCVFTSNNLYPPCPVNNPTVVVQPFLTYQAALLCCTILYLLFPAPCFGTLKLTRPVLFDMRIVWERNKQLVHGLVSRLIKEIVSFPAFLWARSQTTASRASVFSEQPKAFVWLHEHCHSMKPIAPRLNLLLYISHDQCS